MAIISIAEPVFMNFPRSCIAKGHIAGQTKALASPISAKKKIDVEPSVNITPNVNKMPNTAEAKSATRCDMYLGISTIPIKYPNIIAKRV